MTLAIGTNTSFFDRSDYTKNRQQCTLTYSGLQLAKPLDSQEDIVTVIVTEVVDSVSVSGVLPSHVLQERQREN